MCFPQRLFLHQKRNEVDFRSSVQLKYVTEVTCQCFNPFKGAPPSAVAALGRPLSPKCHHVGQLAVPGLTTSWCYASESGPGIRAQCFHPKRDKERPHRGLWQTQRGRDANSSLLLLPPSTLPCTEVIRRVSSSSVTSIHPLQISGHLQQGREGALRVGVFYMARGDHLWDGDPQGWAPK